MKKYAALLLMLFSSPVFATSIGGGGGGLTNPLSSKVNTAYGINTSSNITIIGSGGVIWPDGSRSTSTVTGGAAAVVLSGDVTGAANANTIATTYSGRVASIGVGVSSPAIAGNVNVLYGVAASTVYATSGMTIERSNDGRTIPGTIGTGYIIFKDTTNTTNSWTFQNNRRTDFPYNFTIDGTNNKGKYFILSYNEVPKMIFDLAGSSLTVAGKIYSNTGGFVCPDGTIMTSTATLGGSASGVSSIIAGTGISVSGATGDVTVTATGGMSDDISLSTMTITKKLQITPSSIQSASASTGGAINFTNTSNTGAGMVMYTNAGASTGRLLSAWADNPLFDQSVVHIINDGTANAVEIVNNSVDSTSEALDLTSYNENDTTLGVSGREAAKGTIKVTHNYPYQSDVNASCLSMLLKSTDTGTAAQMIFGDTSSGYPTTGKLVNLRNNGQERLTCDYDGGVVISTLTTRGNATVAGTLTVGGSSAQIAPATAGTTIAILSSATVQGTIGATGQVTSNSRKLMDQYPFAVSISTPYAIGTSTFTVCSPFFTDAVTITTMTISCVGGTNAVAMIQQRDYSTATAANGTNIWSANCTAVDGKWTGAAVSDFTVPANSCLAIKFTSFSGDVSSIVIKGIYTKD